LVGPNHECLQFQIQVWTQNPANFPLCTISAPYDAKNGIQFIAWERFELQKRTTWSSTDFRKGGPAHKGSGYVTPPTPLQSEEDESLPSHSVTSSERESDVSVGMLLKNLFVNTTSIDQLEHEEAIKTFDAEPWAQQLDLQWEKRFEQSDPPTEDRVIQVNLASQIILNPSP